MSESTEHKDENECWEWIGSKKSFGYGQITIQYRNYSAHRVAYELYHGITLNSNQHILHSCDNPSCVNPNHLHIGTHADNMREKVERKRHPRGETNGSHKLTEEQVRVIRESKDTTTSLSKQ